MSGVVLSTAQTLYATRTPRDTESLTKTKTIER